MKTLSFMLLMASSCVFTNAFGQSLVSVVRDTTYQFPGKSEPVNAFTVTVPQAKPDAVKSAVASALEKGNKTKSAQTGTSISINNIILKNVGADTLNAVAEIFQIIGGTQMVIAFESKGKYISRTEDAVKGNALAIWTGEVANEKYREAVKEEEKSEEKVLKDLEKQMAGNIKDIDKCKKNIADNDASIKNLQANIKSKEGEQALQQEKVDAQKKYVMNLPSDNSSAIKEGEKSLKDMEKTKEGIIKEINKMNDAIRKTENDTRDQNNNIRNLEGEQKIIQDKIDAQKEKLNGIRDRQKSIK